MRLLRSGIPNMARKEDPAQAGSVEDEWEKVWSVSIPRSTGSMRYTIGGNLESLAEVGPLVMTLNSRDSTLGVETQESINSINAACTPSPVKSVESGIFSMPSGDISRPSLLLPSMGKTSFMQAEAVPDIGANDFWHDEPVYTKNLPGVTMKRLQKIFRAEPFLIEEALEKDIKAYDMTVSKWQAGVNAPGTFTRSMKYKMPPPDDIPSAARSVITIPKFADCKTFVRMRCQPEELALTFQTVSEGFAVCDHIRLQVTNTFTPIPEAEGGGVTFRRWVVVAWVKELPWALRFLKGIVVGHIMQAGKESSDILSALISERAK